MNSIRERFLSLHAWATGRTWNKPWKRQDDEAPEEYESIWTRPSELDLPPKEAFREALESARRDGIRASSPR